MRCRDASASTRARVLLAGVAVVALLAASCTGDDNEGSGDDVERAGSAAIDGAEVYVPTPIDCATDRYPKPDPATLPADFDEDDYRLSSARADALADSRHHLCGQKGSAVDIAWGATMGSPEIVTAITDSGIRWGDAAAMSDLANQAWLNPGEVRTGDGAEVADSNDDGVLTVADLEDDPRLSDLNENGLLDPQDLILSPDFSDGHDDDGNGFVDDISGWDFLNDDNDPNDDVDYGHGTGEALDATAAAQLTEGESPAAAGTTDGDVGVCPTCRFLPLRVSDSFIADSGRFAAAVFYAIDQGADIVQSALGATDNPSVSQVAIDAAVEAGMPVVASMADEQSSHPNLPTALNHTIAVNSVTDTEGSLLPLPESYLALNGCTNTGSNLWVTVPSDGCSSEAVGRAAGVVGLVLAAARARGIPTHPRLRGEHTSGNPLSANEVAQVLRATADDVDFATPVEAVDGTRAEPANDAEAGPLTSRFPTAPGWDSTSGFGRVNVYEAVAAVEAGSIPPEAIIDGPALGELADARGRLAITGRAAAVRAEGFDWVLEWAPGIDPPSHPDDDEWTEVAGDTDRDVTEEGVLGELDLEAVAASLPDQATGPPVDEDGVPDPGRFAVRVRLRVTDSEGRVGIDQRQIWVHDDPDLVGLDGGAATRRIAGAGASTPVIAEVSGGGPPELVVGTDDGTVHVFDESGDDIEGFPVTTAPAPWWHVDAPAVRRADLGEVHAALGVGRPVVADLDADGDVEIVVSDIAGNIHAWASTGRRLDGFELENGRGAVSVDPDYSSQTDEFNRLKAAFLAQPAAGDLDGDGDLEIVAAAADRHVYAFHDDGTPVDGFPVLVVDQSTVESDGVDPVTHRVRFRDPSVRGGGELVSTPALGDLDGDGRAEIVIGAQEQYEGEPQVSPTFGVPGEGGNSRVYAISPVRAAAGHPEAADCFCNHPSWFAYLWRVPVPMLTTELLPLIGDGVAASPRLGDLDGDGDLDVVVTSAAGPVMALDGGNGRSLVGFDNGVPSALPWVEIEGPPGVGGASALVSAFGGIGLVDLDGDGRDDVVAPQVNDRRAIDQTTPDAQEGSQTLLMAWSGATLEPMEGFPVRTADLAFFVEPAVASIGGRDVAVAGNGVATLDAVGVGGAVEGWPKLTGGWTVGSPAVGDLDGDGEDELVALRRDGLLLTWRL